jgi:hypothetical protein
LCNTHSLNKRVFYSNKLSPSHYIQENNVQLQKMRGASKEYNNVNLGEKATESDENSQEQERLSANTLLCGKNG